MLLTCWSTKGGAGTTVVSALLSLQTARDSTRPTLLVDLCGDLPAAFGNPEPESGLADWLNGDLNSSSLQRTLQELTDNLSLLPRGSGQLNPRRTDALLEWLSSGAPPTSGAPPNKSVASEPLVVVDAGTWLANSYNKPQAASDNPQQQHDLPTQLICGANKSILVTRACYLSLRKAVKLPFRPTGVVLVAEAGRALTRLDCERAIGAPVIATVAIDPDIARAVDAGMLRTRVPKKAMRALSELTQGN
ncbi:MAG: hypothetical protein OXE04_04580 [bacterium]|nr:hypothetical protein [bacterium]